MAPTAMPAVAPFDRSELLVSGSTAVLVAIGVNVLEAALVEIVVERLGDTVALAMVTLK